MQDPFSGRWAQTEPSDLPFLFAGMSRSVADALTSVDTASLTDSGELGGAAVYSITGRVASEALAGLVPGAAVGNHLQLELQIGRDDGLVRTVRMRGVLLANDPPDMVRILRLSAFDVPVTVVRPTPD